MYYIYLHVKKTNGEPFYVGKGKCNTIRYKSNHARNNFWCNIVEKHDFDYIILETNLSHDDACAMEIYWISRIGRRDLNNGLLCNLTDGGEGTAGRVVPIENRNWGIKNGFYGKTHSDETKKKVAIANKNRIWKESTRQKMSESRKGKPIHSEEHKNRARLKILGENNPMFNKKHSIEARQKMSESRKGKPLKGILLLDTVNGIYYDSIQFAAEYNGYKKSTLTAMISGRLKNKSNLIKA